MAVAGWFLAEHGVLGEDRPHRRNRRRGRRERPADVLARRSEVDPGWVFACAEVRFARALMGQATVGGGHGLGVRVGAGVQACGAGQDPAAFGGIGVTMPQGPAEGRLANIPGWSVLDSPIP